MAEETPAAHLIGTKWRRISDGTLIQISSVNVLFEDCTWREINGPKRGQIHSFNLHKNYERVQETSRG